jgi:hypothetical protein
MPKAEKTQMERYGNDSPSLSLGNKNDKTARTPERRYSPEAEVHRPCHTVSVGKSDRVARSKLKPQTPSLIYAPGRAPKRMAEE